MSNQNTEAAYRLTVIRLGVGLTWICLGAYTWFVVGGGPPSLDDRLAVIVIGYAIGLVIAFLPWGRLVDRTAGGLALFAWVTAALVAIVVLPELRDPQTTLFVLVGILAFAIATLPPAGVVGTVVVVVAGFVAVELARRGAAAPNTGRFAGFAAILAILGVGQVALRTRVRAADRRLAEADQAQSLVTTRQAELDQVYSVSRTIGTGRDLAEVLPELVGRVVSAAGARTGAVLLHDAEHGELQLMSPIWSRGLPLRGDRRGIPIADEGLAQLAFRGGEALVWGDATERGDPLLVELGETVVAALPLAAGTETIGILLIGDTRPDPFDTGELATMQSLAGPAGLVLNQLARYEDARALGERMTELAQLKTDFVSVVSHELRTPLTSIIGSLRTLQRPELAPRDQDGKDLLDSAARQADRLKALIEDLLVVSRIDNRALPVRPERVDLRTEIEAIIGSIPGAA